MSVAGLPAIALRSPELELIAVPAAGMRITHLRRVRGREWLWRNPALPLSPPAAAASLPPDRAYVEGADSGGWDECFPTVAPSPVPGGWPGELPDHGELWQAHWESAVWEDPAGATLAASATGERLPYEFHRSITLAADAPEARFDYRLRHTGDRPFPWLWSAHPLLLVQPGTALDAPGLRQVRLAAVFGREDLAAGDIVSWPGGITAADRFVMPPPSGWAVKCFGNAADGPVVVTDPRRGERLEIVADPAEVPHLGLWINAGGWAGGGGEPYYTLGVEPCIGAPDRLADAVEAWETALVLQPGEERRWRLTVRLPEPEG